MGGGLRELKPGDNFQFFLFTTLGRAVSSWHPALVAMTPAGCHASLPCWTPSPLDPYAENKLPFLYVRGCKLSWSWYFISATEKQQI